MPQIAAVVAIIVTVAATAVSIAQAEDQKKQVKKQQRLEEERQQVEISQRELQRAREVAALKADARARRGRALNTGVQKGGLFTTPLAGTINAINANLARELNFSDQGKNLAIQADDIIRRQISLTGSQRIDSITADQISTGIQGLGSIATSGTSLAKSGFFGKDIAASFTPSKTATTPTSKT